MNKTILAMTLATTLATTALAGGDPVAMHHPFDRYLYGSIGGGYAITNLEKEFSQRNLLPNKIMWNDVRNGNGGFTYMGNLGYQFMRYLSVEVGAGRLPTAKYTHVDSTTPPTERLSASESSWFFYGGLRLMTSLNQRFNIYAKAGLMHRLINYNIHDSTTPATDYSYNDDGYTGFIGGIGLNYRALPHLYLSAEYDYLSNHNESRVPAAHLFLEKIGYLFRV